MKIRFPFYGYEKPDFYTHKSPVFSKVYDYIFYRAYIEELFIEFFLLIYVLSRIFYWQDELFFNLVMLDVGICLVKLLPIPGFCAPCPGKMNAVLFIKSFASDQCIRLTYQLFDQVFTAHDLFYHGCTLSRHYASVCHISVYNGLS